MENQVHQTTGSRPDRLTQQHDAVLQKIAALYEDIFLHNGFGELKVTMRFLKRGQKEVVVICGKEFRYVMDYPG